MTDFFKGLKPVKFEGPTSSNPLAYRFYNKDELVMGKRMEDHIRPAVAYWHTFAWEGGDPFGGRTFDRPWYDKGLEGAKIKADVAFELFDLLDAPFFCFHDADVAPEGATLKESNKNLRTITDIFAKKMQSSRTRLLWGTANLFSNRRYMAGAATNPDPYVFAYAAGQVKEMLEITHELGGANYVLWGGREGYETLLNTRIKQEQDQAARFLSLVIEHARKIGFKGQLLIEPKPQEPTKHQYDYDVATVYGFLKTYGLEKEVKVNIEVGHAFLAGHSFEHELAVAGGLGILGSVDANRNDLQSGWDTDQFPNNPGEMALAFYQILKAGGLGKGGFNFDAKVRRQSIEPADLLYGHIGGLDVLARGLKAAAAMIEDGTFDKAQDVRYAGWNEKGAAAMLKGERTLEQIAQWVEADNINPEPRSGQQEYLENLVNRFV
ncbi:MULTISPECIES: xylose isomerase [unclassified Devosia]|uniref:xylose isomerase n=1 Tax=unclassified Devosia TaxID=196773 RepID=UPI00086D2ECA|nr:MULTISPECIES: xylose isomerase [unclassified Devosia]MBN9362400.1 xylose isomerase [Devosia sp.]ODS86800.1 MAG: xylose isomerase [Devosia sp. SCN 66-27]OJX24368.1 MAG: xylose isomerase [Devosia sp. 66-14]